jgi:hypothetical protein
MRVLLRWRCQEALDPIQRRLLASHRIKAGEKRGLAKVALRLLQGLAGGLPGVGCSEPVAAGRVQVAAGRVQDMGKHLHRIEGHALSPLFGPRGTGATGRRLPAVV